jgi:predicted small lipoprotein YifL
MRRTIHALLAALAFLACAPIAGCGAKTGLEIPEYHLDAGLDARDTSVDAPVLPDAPMCMPGRFPLQPDVAEVMLVIDRSASMRLTITGEEDFPPSEWRWAILRDALAGSLGTLDSRVLVGAKFYPDPIFMPAPDAETACRSSDTIDVLPGMGTAPTILSIFDDPEPLGGTPTALALASAAGGFSMTAERRFLVLATDGAPNCNGDLPPATCVCTSPVPACTEDRPGAFACLDDTRTLDVITRLRSVEEIPTYVIGIDGPDFRDVLDQMAIAGGRPRTVPGERAFYSVRSPEQLRTALDEITGSISACGFLTPALPPTDATFSIEIDGALVPESATNGWTWANRVTGELELHGAACESVRLPGHRIEAIIDTCER